MMDALGLAEKVNKFNQQAMKHLESQSLNPFSDRFSRSPSPRPKFSKDEYGKPVAGSLTELRGKKAFSHINREVVELCECISDVGKHLKDPDGDEQVIVSFGELFSIYSKISDKVVGLLIAAKKRGYVYFEPEILFQRRDDDVLIALIKPLDEIKGIVNRQLSASPSPVPSLSEEVPKAPSPIPATSVEASKEPSPVLSSTEEVHKPSSLEHPPSEEVPKESLPVLSSTEEIQKPSLLENSPSEEFPKETSPVLKSTEEVIDSSSLEPPSPEDFTKESTPVPIHPEKAPSLVPELLLETPTASDVLVTSLQPTPLEETLKEEGAPSCDVPTSQVFTEKIEVVPCLAEESSAVLSPAGNVSSISAPQIEIVAAPLSTEEASSTISLSGEPSATPLSQLEVLTAPPTFEDVPAAQTTTEEATPFVEQNTTDSLAMSKPVEEAPTALSSDKGEKTLS